MSEVDSPMPQVDTLSEALEPIPSRTPRRAIIRKDKTNPRRLAYLTLLLFATEPSVSLLVIGAILALAGIAFHGWAAGYLARAGYSEREKKLTVRGPYRHNRNPYYVAHLIMDLGFFCMAGLPYLYLLYFPLIFSVYRRWVLKEERFLAQEFGEDYRAFRANVPRWAIRLQPAPPAGPEQAFDWAVFRINREARRSVPHLLLWGVLLTFAVGGHPLAGTDPLLLITVLAVFATRLLVFDVHPLEGNGFSAAWASAAAVVAVAGGIFLSNAPVWSDWPQAAFFLFVSIGTLLGVFVGISLLPMPHPVFGSRRLERSLERPECQWYLLGVGLGLLSGTLGGVWIGLLLSLLLWMLQMAGVRPFWRLQKRDVTSGAVLLFFSLAAIVSVVRLIY